MQVVVVYCPVPVHPCLDAHTLGEHHTPCWASYAYAGRLLQPQPAAGPCMRKAAAVGTACAISALRCNL